MIRWLVILLVLANVGAWYWLSARQQQRLQEEQTGLQPEIIVGGQGAERPAADRILLLSEVDAKRLQAPAEKKPIPAARSGKAESLAVAKSASPKPLQVSRGCMVLGPLADEVEVTSLQEMLDGAGIKAKSSSREVEGGADFWVYLPPLASAREAARVLEELQKKDIDSFIFPAGEFENGISLGIFSDRTEALRHRDVISDRGYEARIHEVKRKVTAYWLLFASAGATNIEVIDRLGIVGDHPPSRYLEKPCETVASEGQFQ